MALWLSANLWTRSSWFYSQSGHIPGLQARLPVWGMQKASDQWLSIIDVSISMSPFLFGIRIKKRSNHSVFSPEMSYDQIHLPDFAQYIVLTVSQYSRWNCSTGLLKIQIIFLKVSPMSSCLPFSVYYLSCYLFAIPFIN